MELFMPYISNQTNFRFFNKSMSLLLVGYYALIFMSDIVGANEELAQTCDNLVATLHNLYFNGTGFPETVVFPDDPYQPFNLTGWSSLLNPSNITSWSLMNSGPNDPTNASWPLYLLSKGAPIAGAIADPSHLYPNIQCLYPLDAESAQRLGSGCGYPFASPFNTGDPTCPPNITADEYIKSVKNKKGWHRKVCSLPADSIGRAIAHDVQDAVISGELVNPTCDPSDPGFCYTFDEAIVRHEPNKASISGFFFVAGMTGADWSKQYAQGMQAVWATAYGILLPIVEISLSALRAGQEPFLSCPSNVTAYS